MYDYIRHDPEKLIPRSIPPQQNDYFCQNGIIDRVQILPKDQIHFYKLFENVKFSYFVCYHVPELPDENSIGPDEHNVQEGLAKRILIISKDFFVSLQYENEVLENLRLLQNGFPLEKIKQGSEENNMNTPLRDYPPISLNVNTAGGKLDYTGKTEFIVTKQIIVEAMFPMKILQRITSKKLDEKYLSFYFKLPTINTSLTLRDNNVHEIPALIQKEEYLVTLKEISDLKKACIQSKTLYCFKSPSVARDCIYKTREAYRLASADLKERLAKKLGGS